MALVVVAGLFGWASNDLPAATSESLRIEASTAESEYNIGDRIEYVVTVEWKSPVELVGIEPSMALNEFEILRSPEVVEKKLRRGWRQRRTRYSLSTFETGDFTIPEFTIIYRETEGGDEKRIATPPVKITVKSVAPRRADEEEIRDAKGPVMPPSTISTETILIGAAIGGVLAALMVLLIVRHLRKRREETGPAEPPRPIEEVAREALARIAEGDLLERGLVKEYFDQVSDVIRDYLGQRYGFRGIVTTTSELLDALRDQLSDDGRLDLVEEFSNEADLAKFARWKPDRLVCDGFLDTAHRVIDQTTPQPEVVVGAAEPEAPEENDEEAQEALVGVEGED